MNFRVYCYNISFFLLCLMMYSCNNQMQQMVNNEEMLQLDSIADLYYKGEFDNSIEMAKQFTFKYPNNDKGFHLLSSSYLGKKNYSLAEYYADKSLQINPVNYAALTNKGIILDYQEKYNEASVFYEKALQENGSLFKIHSNYMINRIKVKDYEYAIELGEKAVQMGDNIWDKAHLCLSYHKIGNIHKRDSLLEVLRVLEFEKLNNFERMILDDAHAHEAANEDNAPNKLAE